ncbi:hypothetical protein GPJ56_010551 [Histomonas meleagridis]|uniref:uncharacterized protein n=1 Tax=Histomonas meleagridis TaxID=135588 RepID=UPI003559ADBB|nr:hypothetical protein GPJ56_010551 [Histomonas meleagridis]KAH0797991.1 hypothetical protein GO595_009210 [Histomonas meleagridis]
MSEGETETTMMEFRISKRIGSHGRSWTIDVTKLGKEILEEAMDFLKFDDEEREGEHCLVHKISEGYKFINLEKPLKESMPVAHNALVVSKVKKIIKITNLECTRSILIDLTVPICEYLSMIAEKLRFHCQADQYTLYTLTEETETEEQKIKQPLEQLQPIALQTSNTEKLVFKRRFYLIFIDHFADYDNALHIFRDVKQAYFEGPIMISNKKDALDICYPLLYASAATPSEAKEVIANLQKGGPLNDLLPPCVKQSPKLRKKIIKLFEESPPLDRHEAISQFIQKVRPLPGYGCEVYPAKLVLGKGQTQKVRMLVGPRGVTVYDKEMTKIIQNIHILKLQSYSKHHKKLAIKYVKEGKGGKSAVDISTFSLPKGDAIYSYIKENFQVLCNRYFKMRERRNLRAAGLLDQDFNFELVQGMYMTVIEAEAAIKQFLFEAEKLPEVDYTDYGLVVATTPEQCTFNDKTMTQDFVELKKFIGESTNTGKIVLKRMPVIALEDIIFEGAIRRIKMIQENLIEYRNNIFNANIKDAKFFFKTTLDYLGFTIAAFQEENLSDTLQNAKDVLTTVFKLVSDSDSRSRGISEISGQIVEYINRIINEMPNSIGFIEKSRYGRPKSVEADESALSQVNNGQLSILAFIMCLEDLSEYIYRNRIEISKLELQYDILCTSINNMIIESQKFAINLIKKDVLDSELFEIICSLFTGFIDFNNSFNKGVVHEPYYSEIKRRILLVFKTFDLVNIRFLKDGETSSYRLFPGTLIHMFHAMNALQDMEQTIKTLLQYDFARSNQEVNNSLQQALNFIQKTEDVTLSNYKKLQSNPNDQKLRNNSIQLLHEARQKMFELFEVIQPYSSIVDATQQFFSFFELLENSLHSLTSGNTSPTNVDTCIKSITILIKEMAEDNIENQQQWIDRLTSTLNKMKEHYEKLVEHPTDGRLLQPLHELMHITLKDVNFIQKYLPIEKHRTIPLIIELISPFLKAALGNPYMTDEYEKCDHIHLYSQMHYNLALLINMYLTTIEKPYIKISKALYEDISKRVKVLEKIYIELANDRSLIMDNPYAFSISYKIEHTIQQLEISEANLIKSTTELDTILLNCTFRKCLALSMKSIRDYFDEVGRMHISPYRPLPTTEGITEYRKNLINFTAALRNVATMPGVNQDDAKFLTDESNQIMKMVVDVTKAGKSPSHDFDNLIINIERYIQSLYIRGDQINEFKNSNEITEKIDELQNANEKIIYGLPTTEALFEQLLCSTIEWLTKFTTLDVSNISKNAQEFVYVCSEGFKDLINFLNPYINNHKYDEDIIITLRDTMLQIDNACPPIPKDILNAPNQQQTINLMQHAFLSLKDSINYARQFIKLKSIELNFQKLEVSVASEIQELGDVLLEQLETLSSVFEKQLLTHVIVKRSQRLQVFISQLYTFFNNNYQVLLSKKNELESILEAFCREISPTLEVIIYNVQLLHPLFTDDKLIGSCINFQQNVLQVVKRFEHHHMTSALAQQFIENEMARMNQMKQTLLDILENPIVQSDQALLDFINNSLKLFDQLPEDLSTMKPSQLQSHCDEIYNMLSELLNNYLGILNDIGVAGDLVIMQKGLGKYVSCEQKNIYITDSLIVKEQPVGESELNILFDQILDQLSDVTPISLSMNEYLIGYMYKLSQKKNLIPSYISHAQNVFSPEISQGNIPVVMGSLRTLACSEKDPMKSHVHLQRTMIKCMVKAALLAKNLLEILKKTKPVTIYHEGLINLLEQADLSMLIEHQNLPSALLAYPQLKQIAEYIPLVQITDEEFSTISTQFLEFMNEVDSSISNDFMISYDHILNKLEMSEVSNQIDIKCDEVYVELTSEKAKKAFGTLIPQMINLVQELSNMVGEIEQYTLIQKEAPLAQEIKEDNIEEINIETNEEEKKVEEEIKPDVDPDKLVLDIYNAIQDRSIDKLRNLVDTLLLVIDNTPKLKMLKNWALETKEAIENGNFAILEKNKSILIQYFTENLPWQTSLLKSVQGILNVNDAFIDQQRALNEILISYIDSSDRPAELKKLAKIAADSQSLTVHSFKFFSNIEQGIYFDFYQTSQQMWASLLLLFGNPTDVAIKRSFRSLARLLAGLSYVVEDASFQQPNNEFTEFETKKLKFYLSASLIYYHTAYAISTFAISPFQEVYDSVMKDFEEEFQNCYNQFSFSADEMVKMNNSQTTTDSFNNKRSVFEKSFHDFEVLIQTTESLKDLIEGAQELQSNLQQLCIISKQLSDVYVQQPDSESVSKLPSKFVMPSLPTEEVNIDIALKTLEEIMNNYQESQMNLKNLLFDKSSTNNQEIVDYANQFFKTSTEFITSSLQFSIVSDDISAQSEITLQLSQLTNEVEKINKSIKDRLMLRNDWADEANQSFEAIKEKITEILNIANNAMEHKKEQSAVADEIKSEIESSIKAILNSQAPIESFISSLNDKPQGIQREWATSLSELCINSTRSFQKILLYLYNHPKEISKSIQDVVNASNETSKLIEKFMENVKNISNLNNDEDNEDKVIEVAKSLIQPIKLMMSQFNNKSTEGKVHAETLNAIIGGIDTICNTAEKSKKIRIEKAEAAKLRAERRAAAEERRRKAAQERKNKAPPSSAPIKTKEELMKRLNLESRVIRARMLLENQQMRLEKFNSSH